MLWMISAAVGLIVGLISYVTSRNRVNLIFNLFFGLVGSIFGAWFFFIILRIVASTVVGNLWLTVLWSLIGSTVILGLMEMFAASAIQAYRVDTHSRSVAHEYSTRKVKTRRRPSAESKTQEDQEVYRREKDDEY